MLGCPEMDNLKMVCVTQTFFLSFVLPFLLSFLLSVSFSLLSLISLSITLITCKVHNTHSIMLTLTILISIPFFIKNQPRFPRLLTLSLCLPLSPSPSSSLSFFIKYKLHKKCSEVDTQYPHSVRCRASISKQPHADHRTLCKAAYEEHRQASSIWHST